MRITTLQNVYFIVLLGALNVRASAKNLVVASYNLWNVMFQWDVRKHFIAEMVGFGRCKKLKTFCIAIGLSLHYNIHMLARLQIIDKVVSKQTSHIYEFYLPL